MKLTNEEFNTLCESSASTGLRGSVEHLITEAEAETVERCAQVIQKLYAHARRDTDEGKEYAAILFQLMSDIRALSPDPNFLARERLKARLDEHACTCREGRDCFRCKELERELTLLSQGVGGLAAMEEK